MPVIFPTQLWEVIFIQKSVPEKKSLPRFMVLLSSELSPSLLCNFYKTTSQPNNGSFTLTSNLAHRSSVTKAWKRPEGTNDVQDGSTSLPCMRHDCPMYIFNVALQMPSPNPTPSFQLYLTLCVCDKSVYQVTGQYLHLLRQPFHSNDSCSLLAESNSFGHMAGAFDLDYTKHLAVGSKIVTLIHLCPAMS